MVKTKPVKSKVKTTNKLTKAIKKEIEKTNKNVVEALKKVVKNTSIGYNIRGAVIKNVLDNKCFAYSDSKNYYIRRGTYGHTNGKLLNPWGLYFSPGDENRFNSIVGKRFYEYSKVSKNAFDNYVSFLRTRNIGYLNQAEREI